MRAALLDDSLQSINIEQKFFDIVQNKSADKYVTDPQRNLFNILCLLQVSVYIRALFICIPGDPHAAGNNVPGRGWQDLHWPVA